MKLQTALKLAEDLRELSHTTAGIVHFNERGGINWEMPDETDMPNDDLYGVKFHAYDALIPQSVVDVIAKYETQGIYIQPDTFIVCPRAEVDQ